MERTNHNSTGGTCDFSYITFKLLQYLKILLMLITISKLCLLLRPTTNMLFNELIKRNVYYSIINFKMCI